jgi:hypothetical protein
MPPTVPRDPLGAADAAFITYKRYLEHFELALTQTYGEGPILSRGIREAIRSLPAARRIKRRPLEPSSSDEVGRHLRMAWNRESRIRLVDADANALPQLLPGTATDSYYAIFHGAQAWIAASGQPQTRDHAQVLRVIGNAIVERHLFPPPWDLVCVGYPTRDEAEFLGLPQAVIVGPLHNWQHPRSEAFHDGLCMLLRTTRAKLFEQRKVERRKKHQKNRVPTADAHSIAQRIPPTTLFDFLWRLRIRTDYQDIDALIPGTERPHHAVAFHQALVKIVEANLAVFESLIELSSGSETLSEAAKAFVKKTGPESGIGVKQRVLTQA